MSEAEFFTALTGSPNDLALTVQALHACGQPVCLIGGLAVNHYAEPMVTLDANSAIATGTGDTAGTSCGWPNNILVIWGDDIGTENISYYHRGMMGYQTPNIDRLGTVSQPSVKIGPSFFLKLRDAEQKVGRKWM